jgi:hypothetical protein
MRLILIILVISVIIDYEDELKKLFQFLQESASLVEKSCQIFESIFERL